jgi:hypothetical protein
VLGAIEDFSFSQRLGGHFLGSSGKISDLLRWADDAGGAQDEYFALVSRHPRFAEAARALSRNMRAQADIDPAFDALHKDAGRFVAGCWAMSLHLSGGLTLPRFKETCAKAGMSPGRARSLLQFFLFLRYVEIQPANEPRGPIRYVPTQAMLDSRGTMVRVGLEAVRVVEPAVSVILSQLDDPGILERFMAHLGDGFLPSVLAKPLQQFMDSFVEPHAGVALIDLIVQAGEGDEFPSSRPIPVSINAIAQRLRVSRAHIRRLLDRGHERGMLTRRDDGTILLGETLRATLRYFAAVRLYGFLVCAAKTYAETAHAETIGARP